MKPDWNDAPDWANWLAMEPDGSWFWYRAKPVLSQNGWDFSEDDPEYLHVYAGASDPFEVSLTARPQTTTPQPEGQGDEGKQGA